MPDLVLSSLVDVDEDDDDVFASDSDAAHPPAPVVKEDIPNPVKASNKKTRIFPALKWVVKSGLVVTWNILQLPKVLRTQLNKRF